MSGSRLHTVGGETRSQAHLLSCGEGASCRGNVICDAHALTWLAHAVAAVRDPGDMTPLVVRRFDLQRGRHTRAIGAHDRRGAIRRGAVHVVDAQLSFERIGQADHYEAEMEKDDME